MSSYWSKRRRIARGVQQDLQQIAAAYADLANAIPHSVTGVCPHRDQSKQAMGNERTESPAWRDVEGAPLSEEDCEEWDLRAQLVEWADESQVSQNALSKLLHILSKDHPGLSKDHEFHKIRTGVRATELAGGTNSTIDHGILDQLLEYPDSQMLKPVSLQINVDDIPLCRSSNGHTQSNRPWMDPAAPYSHLHEEQYHGETQRMHLQIIKLSEENETLRAKLADKQPGVESTPMLQLYRTLAEDNLEMKAKLDLILASQLSSRHCDEDLLVPEGIQLPVKSRDDLDLLENRLRQNSDLQEQLVKFLVDKGGKDLRNTVWRMMPSLISNDLALITTWTGAGDKVCFKDLLLKTILHRAIRRHAVTREATEDGIQIMVSRYLRGAPDREGGRKRRKTEQNAGPESKSWPAKKTRKDPRKSH